MKNDLASLQKMVGGYIECVYPYEDPVGIVCDEEGKINGKELNRALRDENGNIYDILAGTFLVVGLGDEDFDFLPKDLCEKYSKKFEYPEMFFYVGNKLETVKLEVKESVHKPKHR